MDSRYVFVYTAVNVFCILVSLVILSKISYNVGSEHENRYFRGMTLCFLGFVLLEFLWALGEGNLLALPHAVTSSFKAISTLLIPFMVYLWFWFAEIRFRSPLIGNSVARIVTFIPIAVLLICYIISVFNGMVFGLDAEGNLVPGPLVGLTGLVDNIYGIAIIIHAIILFVKETVPYRRSEYVVQIIFIILCTAGGIIDAIISSTPIMPLAIALAFVFLFANLQEKQIYNDALTGLNNRRRADEYVVDSIAAASDANPLYLFILDIDKFKSINDTMGHLEGDRVLKAVAKGIAKATDNYNGFAARWGGDEFIVAVGGSDPDLAQNVQQSFASCITESTQLADIEYAVSASVGMAKCTDSATKLTDLVAKADAALYEQKRANIQYGYGAA